MTLGSRFLEPAEVGQGDLRLLRPDRVRSGQPARAEHDGGVEVRRAGQFPQVGGAGLGTREGVPCIAHDADHLAVWRRLSRTVLYDCD